MPSWDEITPYLERETTASRRLNAVNVLIGLNIAGLFLPALGAILRLHTLQDFVIFSRESSIEGLRLWQFFTYTFWHPITTDGAGNHVELLWSVLGLALGCWILHSRGRELENEWGWKRLATFYVATAVYGAVASATFEAMTNARLPAFDFLGPVLAVYLVWALKNRNARVHVLFFEMRALASAFAFIGIVFLYVLGGFWKGTSPIASLGAPLAGWLIHALEPKLDSWFDGRDQRVARQRFLDEFELKRQVDAILEKISRGGMDSLSGHEKRLLKRASRLFGGGPGG